MRRPSLVVTAVAAAMLPLLARGAPAATPLPVTGTFDRVALRGDFDAEVREGSPASVEVVAEPGLAGRVEAEVSGGTLRLSRKKEFDSAKGVLGKVTVPSFRGLSVSGSGKGTAESGPAARDVALSVSGSGDLAWKGVAAELDVSVSGSGKASATGEAAAVKVSVSGSGSATLKGKGSRLTANVAGSGHVTAKEFPVTDASVSVAGSGDVALRLAGGTLDARIAGSGDVEWWGDGKVGSVSTAGSGRVLHR